MDILERDILNLIFEILDFLSKIRLRQISKYFLNNLYISDFYNLDKIYLENLTEQILVSYPKIKYLDIQENPSVQNINFLSDLQVLAISDKFTNQFCNYNLRELQIYNYKITNLKYFTKLEKLSLSNISIPDSDLNNLNLRELNLYWGRLSNISHMTRLKKLVITGYCDITNSHIQNLDLLELTIIWNSKITEINFLTNIRSLRINNNIIYDLSNINPHQLNITNNNSDFSHMTNLTKLDLTGGINLNLSQISLSELTIKLNTSDFSHMTNLTRLDMIQYYSRINLNKLTKLKYLNCNCSDILDGDISNINPIYLNISNTQITNISHLTNLQKLCAMESGITEITNPNLETVNINGKTNIKIISLLKLKILVAYNPYLEQINCPNLVQLYLSKNTNIINLNNLKNLKKLTLLDNCSIYNTSIQTLELEIISLLDNQTITDLNFMTSLKILSINGNSGLTCTNIQKLNLLELELRNTNTISDINNLTNLKILQIIGPENGLKYPGIKNLNINKIKLTLIGLENIYKSN